MSLFDAPKFLDFVCKQLDSRLKNLEKSDKSNKANLKLVNNGIEKIKELMEITSITETYRKSNESRSIMNEYQQYYEISFHSVNDLSSQSLNPKNEMSYNSTLKETIIRNLEDHAKPIKTSYRNNAHIELPHNYIRDKTPTRIIQDEHKQKIIKKRNVKSPSPRPKTFEHIPSPIHKKCKIEEKTEHNWDSSFSIKTNYESQNINESKTQFKRSKSPLIQSSNKVDLLKNGDKSPVFHQRKVSGTLLNKDISNRNKTPNIHQRGESDSIPIIKEIVNNTSHNIQKRRESTQNSIKTDLVPSKSSINERKEINRPLNKIKEHSQNLKQNSKSKNIYKFFH